MRNATLFCGEDATNRIWLLTQLELFAGMTPTELAQIAAVMHDRECHVGDEIELRPTGDTVYVVKHGRVRLESGNVAVGVLGPGQLFGTSSFFGTAPARERAVAIEEVIICEAPAGEFLGVMCSYPVLAARMAQLLARQLSELERSLQRAAEDPVEARLAALVLQMAECDRAHQVRGLSQADLARLIGASRESVSRLMASWERNGWIRARHRALEVRDAASLRARLVGESSSTTA